MDVRTDYQRLNLKELLCTDSPKADKCSLLMESARTAIHKCVRPDFARQRLEWLASAARSTVVSTAVSDFDRDERTVLADYVRSVREERRVHNDTSVEAIVEVIMGLFEGLMNRSMSRADFCVEELQDLIAVVIRAALDA